MSHYKLGEPLTEAIPLQHWVAVHNHTGEVRQGTFYFVQALDNKSWTYYADPRPMPKLSEADDDLIWFNCEDDDRFTLTAAGQVMLETALNAVHVFSKCL